MKRRILLCLVPLAALAACDRRQPAEAPPPPEAAAPAPTVPLTYEQATPQAEVKLVLPPETAAVPALYSQLYAAARNDLAAFAEGAKGELDELRAAGFPATPYGREIAYRFAAETPRLISLVRQDYEFTGGAHPNTALQALVWDKPTGRALTTADLIRSDADTGPADRALCDAIRREKQARTGSAALNGELTACPRLREVSAALVPSTVEGKAGGLTAVFSPYAIGPYAEGAYEITLPQTAFRAALAPAYVQEFDGAPASE